MGVQPKEIKEKRFSREKWLQWSEYGTNLALIPGTFLAILTGQFAFVASPLTVSLWLNLFRRQYCDRQTLRMLYVEQQNLMYRYESVLESTRRDRAELLINHAGELPERDQPQLMNVLEFRLQCIEKNRASLQAYLEESYQAVEVSLQEIQGFQIEQSQRLELLMQHLESLNLPEWSPQNIDDFLRGLSEQVERLQDVFTSRQPMLIQEIEGRLRILEESLHTLESPRDLSIDDPGIQALWSSVEQPMLARLDELRLHVSSDVTMDPLGDESDISEDDLQSVDAQLEVQLDRMHLALTEQLNEWETLHRDQGYKLQRLNEKVIGLKQTLEKTYQTVLENSVSLEQSLMQSQLMMLNGSEFDLISGDSAEMQRQLDQIKFQLNQGESPSLALTAALNSVIETATERIEGMNEMAISFISLNQETLDGLLTPLLQHLSDCEEKLSRLTQAQLGPDATETVLGLESRMHQLFDHLESLGSSDSDEMAPYNHLYVQLSMIRCQAEELKSQVAIEMEQVPFMIDNYLRQRYPIQK